MLFVVRFEDHQDRPSLRGENLPAHVEWLDKHRDEVLVAGSLRQNLDAHPIGGLWIVEAPSKQAVIELVATDPFSVAGLRKKVEIHHWSKAFEDRKVMV